MSMMMIPSVALLATCIAAIWSCNGNAIITASAAGTDCTTVMYDMLTCVDYIVIGSTRANASKECCKAAGDVMNLDSKCMCEVLRQSGGMGIHVNLTRALALPASCGIPTPLPDCDIPLPPGMAPALSTKAPTPTPVPSTKAPAPVPRKMASSPTPAPRRMALTPTPTTTAPTPTPTPTTTAPTPATPTRAPTPALAPSPVNPLAPPAPTPEVAPMIGGPTADSPGPAPSGAASFTISSNVIVPLLFTILASFRPL